jgi:hypothetical protein
MLKKKFAVIVVLVLLVSLALSVHAFARVTLQTTVYLPSQQKWSSAVSHTRSGMFSTVGAYCESVYPPGGGIDTYTKMQFKVTTTWGQDMTDVVTISENDANFTYVSIKEGTYNEKNVNFLFRGNNPSYDAYAVVQYDAC